MATLTKQYVFSGNTKAVASQVNVNFDDIIAFLNNQVVHVDGSKAMTGVLTLPASDPVSANQATRKSYVDAAAAAASSAASAAQTTANTANTNANTALARVPNTIRWGTVTGTTNGAGDISFPHGLGGVPSSVVVNAISTGPNVVWRATIENKDGTNVNLRVYNTTTGNAMPAAGVSFHWFAAL